MTMVIHSGPRRNPDWGSSPFGPRVAAIPFSLRVIGALLGVLLFLPKINLIEIGGSRAGIRIDDIMIAILLGCTLAVKFSDALWVLKEKTSKLMIAFIVLGFFESVFTRGNFLFPMRLGEYLAIYVIARLTVSPKGLRIIIGSYLCVNVVVCTLQLFGVVGGFAINEGYTTISERYIGLTNGAWELGTLAVIGYCAMVLPFEGVSMSRFAFWSIVAGLLLAFSGARTAAMSFVLLLAYLLIRLALKGRLVLVVSLVLSAATIYMFSTTFESEGLTMRSRASSFQTTDNFQFFIDAMKDLDLKSANDNADRDDEAVGAAGLDVSLNQRIFIVAKLVSGYANGSVFEWIFGLGLGYFGPSSDVGWLRVFVETGVVGFFLFIWYLVAVSRSGLREIGVSLACILAFNMVTLDAFLGYKIMFVYYLVLAWAMSFGAQGDHAIRSRMTQRGRMMGARWSGRLPPVRGPQPVPSSNA